LKTYLGGILTPTEEEAVSLGEMSEPQGILSKAQTYSIGYLASKLRCGQVRCQPFLPFWDRVEREEKSSHELETEHFALHAEPKDDISKETERGEGRKFEVDKVRSSCLEHALSEDLDGEEPRLEIVGLEEVDA
jgi:hypothetical protein